MDPLLREHAIKRHDQIQRTVWRIVVALCVGAVCFWAVVIYVVGHFVAKVW